MYKILIVEDEAWISALIRSILEEGIPSAQVVGEAANGWQALDMIARLQPDIVLTDINLPQINGLQVIEQSKEAGFAGRFIIISGYNDFAYVQQAIRFGVEDYLLKPIDDTELCQLVMRLTDDLDISAKAARSADQNDTIIKAQLLNQLTMRKFLPLTVCNEAYATHFTNGLFCCVAAKFNAGCLAAKEKFSEQAKQLEQMLMAEIGPHCGEAVPILRGTFFILLLGYPAEAAEAVRQGLEKGCRNYLEHQTSITSAVIGVSGVHEDFSAFQEACRQTIWTVNARCARGSHLVYTADNYSDPTRDGYTVTGPERELLAKTLGEMEGSPTLQWFQRHLEAIVEQHRVTDAEAFLLLPYVASLLEAFFETAAREFPQTPIQRGSYVTQAENCITAQDLQTYITELIRTVKAEIQEQKKAADHTIDHITEYISTHLTDTLSLEEVASAVYLTPGYLSEYFKSKMGTNFKDYVLRLRMERAKQLLSRHAHVQEIAQQCGYTDVKYFCKIFKKYYGMTPTEFRRIYG